MNRTSCTQGLAPSPEQSLNRGVNHAGQDRSGAGVKLGEISGFQAIAALRKARGETLEVFGVAIGMASKSKVSELERGLIRATPEQALAIERLAEGAVDAATLSEVIAAARGQAPQSPSPQAETEQRHG